MPPSGTVVLSLDAELNWGFHDHDRIPTERVKHSRESWLYILDLFEENEIPATWAIVGHLFLDRCDGVHSDHPIGEEWFSRDPGGEYQSESGWFGQDLINAIRDSDVNHDIGSHSFSHVEFGKDQTTEEIARAELQHSINAAEGHGIDLKSFVFPRNNIGHRKLLRDYDFLCYRGNQPERWYDKTPIRQVGKLTTFTLGVSSPPIVKPEMDEFGLVNIPASMYLFTFEGTPRNAVETVSTDPIVRQVEQGLRQLTKNETKGIFHLWFHPNNITSKRDRQRLSRIVSMIAENREQHDIDVKTMSQIAKQVTK